MILSIIILIYLISKIYNGYKKGFTNRLLSYVGKIVTFVLALFLQAPIGQIVFQFIYHQDIQTSVDISKILIARFVAFFAILIIGYLIIISLKVITSPITNFAPIKLIDSLIGMAFNFIISYVLVFVIVSMLNILKVDWFMSQASQTPLIDFILHQTPIFTQQVFNEIFAQFKNFY